jgi:hypothetical protein
MRRFFLSGAVVAASLVLTLHAVAVPADDVAATVQELYQYAHTHFGCDPDSVKGERRWLTPELYARLWKKVNEPVPKGDAPDIEGDVFLNSQEPLDRFFVFKPAVNGDTARVRVNTILPGETRHVTVMLIKIDGAWKVRDVDYGQDGKLSDLLK